MSAFNTICGQVMCPRCTNAVDVVGQFKFGSVWQIQYRIGDVLQWGRNEIGTPGIGRVVVDAVAETACPMCRSVEEWNLYLKVERDKLMCLETAHGEYDFVKAGVNFIVIEP